MLPYPMQLGSGTVDLLPGIIGTYRPSDLSFGAQANGTLQLGRNGQGYSLGNAYQLTGWAAWEILPWVSLSLRLDWHHWFDIDIDIDGDRLNPRVVPTADPDLRAGRRLDGLVGVNFLVTRGPLAGNRSSVESGAPLYQPLDGPQLETDWRLTAGWQCAF